ncbi:MAG: hypothetical protein EA370_13460 [Wenzhouxiangella sp.]|nr:MAG: hypothetical protein EA370_13460 [Wenzhouxiangella sp.]
MAAEFLNAGSETCAKNRDYLERVFILILIHDMLPWDDEQRGLSLREIGETLKKAGFHRCTRSIQRDLDELMLIARIHYDRENARPRRFHRLHSQRLSDNLSDSARRVARFVLDGRDWPSQIQIER